MVTMFSCRHLVVKIGGQVHLNTLNWPYRGLVVVKMFSCRHLVVKMQTQTILSAEI